MTCELSQLQLQAYFDGELDAPNTAAIENHLRSCGECQSALASEQALRSSFVQAQLYERAPASLARSVAKALPVHARAPERGVSTAWRWLAIAASLLFLTSAGWQLLQYSQRSRREPVILAAAVDAHLRSLQQGHLADVESTDQHTVKPWFDGKLDFAPPVGDFASDGFPLLGGRLDVLDGKTVAALVYGRRKHIINVFVWPSNSGARSGTPGGSRGYNYLEWRKDGFDFCAVSDVSPTDLQNLQQLMTQ